MVAVRARWGGGRGYDVSADTVNGGISLGLSGAEPVGEQTRTSKHVRTDGFSGADIQTTVTVETVNGGIEVRDG